MTKKEIRDSVSARRNAMGEEQVMLASQAIMENLQASAIYRKAGSVLFYCSTGGEVYTHGAIAAALAAGKTVVLPKSNVKTMMLELYKIHSMSELSRGAYGVLEPMPDKNRMVSASDIDMLIIPGVAFDKRGNRIGLGLGYYDRLLKGLSGAGRICALAYSFQIVPQIELPHDAHDVPMDYVFSEDAVIECRKFRKPPAGKAGSKPAAARKRAGRAGKG